MSYQGFESFIIEKTEGWLIWRKRRKLVKKEKARRVHAVIDWAIAILVIIATVILINMFLFQNYRIPSASMLPVLQEGDLIFVEKLPFGPEILPGQLKLPAFRLPHRGEVVSFEAEIYAKDGPFVELWQRFIYFITLSAVNLKTDENNQALKDLLIKRTIGLPGDKVRLYQGNFEIMPAGEAEWISEKKLLKSKGVSYRIIWANSFIEEPFYKEFTRMPFESIISPSSAQNGVSVHNNLTRSSYQQSPQAAGARGEWFKSKLGWYVPPGMFFPMGDNRTNSHDARNYGPVPLKRIQGKALFRFFPFTRIGGID